MKELIELSKPLSIDQIDFRVQSINKGGYATILAYKDARVDINRLNDVCGLLGWKREHTRDNKNCIVSIWDDKNKHWVSKEDTGTESNTEQQKGLASDSFKRACFNWGIGIELYDYPVIQVKLIECTKTDGKYNMDGEYQVDSTGKAKPTWLFKLKEWKWLSEFEGSKITSLIAIDNKGKKRFAFGLELKEQLTPTHESWNKAAKSLAEGGVDVDKIRKKYHLTEDNRILLLEDSEMYLEEINKQKQS